ncbi:MAG: hypothetical protein GY859_24230 [Desulfobacterales bacterium]|nr:hypothetical protein [Desulfobacterales bacterium]
MKPRIALGNQRKTKIDNMRLFIQCTTSSSPTILKKAMKKRKRFSPSTNFPGRFVQAPPIRRADPSRPDGHGIAPTRPGF